MRNDVPDALRRWLGEDTRAVDVLSDHDLEQLHNAFTSARNGQAAALAAASDEALRQMPAPLRAGVAKILGR
jgi:hypothetical protein